MESGGGLEAHPTNLSCFWPARFMLLSNVHRLRILRTSGVALLVASTSALCLEQIARADLTGSSRASPPTHQAPRRATRPALRFEPNRGQFDDRVRYLARGNGYGLYLTRDGATLALSRSKTAVPHANGRSLPRASDLDQAVVSMRVVGSRSVEPAASVQLEGASNYFVGGDPSRWKTGVESYASVRYDDVLPGVSVVYYGSAEHELEYDFVLAPGASPQSIEIAFDGVQSIEIDAHGNATLHLPGGAELRKPAPVAYQINNQGERVPVASRYELRPGGRLGFVVGHYDSARVLRIDPVLLYSTYLGGSSFDQAYAVATDAAGESYVIGYTSSTLFPTVAPLQASLAGGVYDAFVCKLSSTGALIYATFLGGSGADLGYAIASDTFGNAYVAGVTFSTDFPTVTPFQATAGGKQDAFVAKLNPLGSALVYSTYLGGNQDDYVNGIAVGAAGNAFLVGTTFSANFPKAAPLQAALSGTSDAFVSNLAPNGASLTYSTYLGGTDIENGYGIAADATGNVFVVGSTASNNFPTVTPFQAAFGGGAFDGFVSKLNATGSALIYSSFLGGLLTDEALGVATSASGATTVAGYTLSSNFPVLSAPRPSLGSAGHSDAFVSRLNASGATLAYSTYLGGTGDDSASAVGVDSLGTAYVVGSTNSGDFPLIKPISGQSAYHGGGDGFVTAVDPPGLSFSYSTYLGGSAEDHAVAVAVQSVGGTTHIVGNTLSTDFPILSAPISALVGSQDGFLTKLPGSSVSVPASTAWNLFLLAGALLGAGLLAASLRLKRLA